MLVVFLLVVLSGVIGCGSDGAVGGFVYQLQGYADDRLDEVAAAPFRTAVVDLARNAGDSYFEHAEVDRVRTTGKVVLAYFELGSIEDFRPDYGTIRDAGLLLNEWPTWPGERFVRYWDPRWWDLAVKPRVDRALTAGFDGVYLDTPLAYEEIDLGLVPGLDREVLGRRMVDLIVRTSEYAKRVRPGFRVFPQNSPELSGYSGYLAAVDGIGIEELFFRATDERCVEDYCATNLEAVRELRRAGKTVLAVDYAEQPGNIAEACRRYREEGFDGYVSARALDRVGAPCR